ncbi:hypothetical protein ACWGII_18660 [Streptomyces sp. NPDC054855]
MITREWRHAQHRTTVRRASSILFLVCLLLALVLGALALASPSARSAPTADALVHDGRAPLRSEQDVCAAIAGPARDHCERVMRAAAAPRAASQEPHAPVWVLAPAATAVLALVAVRRVGRPATS